MNLDVIWDEIEKEQAWREEEIQFFQNFLLKLPKEDDQKKYRRALVLILYAHFEGFCKYTFAHYIKTINDLQIKCKVANYSLVAAALTEVFTELRDPHRKNKVFQRSLPDDSLLHRFARDREFLEKIDELNDRDVSIPEKAIDTDSNLKPEILQKILFRLGLPHDKFDNIKDKVHKLLNLRNRIAHGESKDGLSQEEYDSLRESVFFIMNEVKRDIMESIKNKSYLRI